MQTYLENLRRRAANARAQRELLRQEFSVRFKADREKARTVVEESDLPSIVKAYQDSIDRKLSGPEEIGNENGDKPVFEEVRYTARFDYQLNKGEGWGRPWMQDGTYCYSEFQIAVKPDGVIEVRGNPQGTSKLVKDEWRRNRDVIENAIKRAAEFPIAKSGPSLLKAS